MDDLLCPPLSRPEIPTAAAAEETAGRSNPQLQWRGRRTTTTTTSNRETDDRVNRISDLPEQIIHHIVSFLPTTEATRVSAVSKTFRSVMGSFPIFDFDFDLFIKNSELTFELCEEAMTKFLNYIDDTIKRRHSHELDFCIQKFRLLARISSVLNYEWNWTGSDHRINRAIGFAIERGVKELEIDLEFAEPYLFPKLITSSAKSNSITTLKLKGFKLDLNDLILSFPMVESLSLAKCALKNVKFLSPNLRVFDLQPCYQDYRINSIEIGVVNLQSFICRGTFEIIDIGTGANKNLDIGIGACKNLKNLTLYRFTIPKKGLHKQISQLHGLDNLVLEQCLGKIEISHQNLKSLCLLNCFVEDVEVDAPKLVSFMYKGIVVPFRLLNPTATVLDATLIFLRRCWYSVGVDCFVRFRNFLSSFGHCKSLTLSSSEKHLIFPEGLRDVLGSPLCDLKHLKVVTSSVACYTKLVDGLLWLAPHLETLCFSSKETEDQDSEAKFIKFYYGNTREGGRGDSNCLVEMVNFENVDDKDNLLKYFQQKASPSIQHNIVECQWIKKYIE